MVNVLEINRGAFLHNLKKIKDIVGKDVEIMPVLKSDAYGHGLYELSKIVVKSGIHKIAVGTPEEGIFLKERGIKSSIIALDGITFGLENKIIKNDIASVVSSHEQFDRIEKESNRLGKTSIIHFKIDTGMGRLGLKTDRCLDLIEKGVKSRNIIVEGLMTHFAESCYPDNDFTRYQIGKFNELLACLRKAKVCIPVIHAANSGAILNYPDSYFNLVRPGIVLYGCSPSISCSNFNGFLPVMSFKTKIVHVNHISKGESASYNRLFVAKRDTKTAVIPVGYAHGYSRLLSDKTSVIVNGKKVRQIGIICMNLSVLDITDFDDIEIGDEVVVIGSSGDEKITIEELAEKANTISYELMCMIGSNVKKVYI